MGGLYPRSAFQPIFAFDHGKVTIAAFEGLIRPFRDGEALSPAAFFNLIAPGDRLHVETLTRTLHLLNAGACLDPKAAIFINFDPSLFSERAVADGALRDMRLVLHEADVDPRRIVCEVTEQKSSSSETLHSFVQALRAHGFRIAVDDYGAHDSDIERIRALKPDIVKFDAQWITRLMESGPGFALLHAMVTNFADQGIETVFEGIEEGWQLDSPNAPAPRWCKATCWRGRKSRRPALPCSGAATIKRLQPRLLPKQVSSPNRPGGRTRRRAASESGRRALDPPISNGAGTSSFVDEIGIEIGIIGDVSG